MGIRDSIAKAIAGSGFTVAKARRDPSEVFRPEFDYTRLGRTRGIQLPLSPIHPIDIEEVSKLSVVIRTAITNIRNEIFRRGYEWSPKFTQKCLRCDKEFNVKQSKCDKCGCDEFVEPSEKEKDRAEEFFKVLNKNRDNLMWTLSQFEQDILTHDDGYLVFIKDYLWDSQGKVVHSTVKEIIRGSPIFMRCFSPDTEVLTKDGWKNIATVKETDEIATLNQNNDTMEYQLPTEIIKQHFNGNLIEFKNNKRNYNILVTPYHDMLVRKRARIWNRNQNETKWHLKRAIEVSNGEWQIRKDVKNWNGNKKEKFELPGYDMTYLSGEKYRIKKRSVRFPKTFNMNDFLEFFGYFISEGYTRRNTEINIAQEKSLEKIQKIEECLVRIGLKYTKSPNGFTFHNSQLARWLSQFGKSHEKFIPTEFKELSREQLSILLDALLLGDGSVDVRTGSRVYSTVSRKLAEDVQELFLKCGVVANITKFSQSGNPLAKNDLYQVVELQHNFRPWLQRGEINELQYNGSVYCVTVPNHTLYVRREGYNPSWCGNCVGDRRGNRGGVYFVCLQHRDYISQDPEDRCPQCNSKLYDVWYVGTEYGEKPTEFYVGPSDDDPGECLKISRYSPTLLYGTSLILSCWKLVVSLLYMENYIHEYYRHMRRPRGFLAVNTKSAESLQRWWDNVSRRVMEDPFYQPLIAYEGEQGRGRVQFVTLDSTLYEMQYIQVRDEFRDRIFAIYGVSREFVNAQRSGVGLANEGLQILVTNRMVEWCQSTYNDVVFPYLLEQLRIKDWNLRLKPSEAKDQMASLARFDKKVDIAKKVMTLGFDIDMEVHGPGDDLDNYYFIYKKRDLPMARIPGTLPPPGMPRPLMPPDLGPMGPGAPPIPVPEGELPMPTKEEITGYNEQGQTAGGQPLGQRMKPSRQRFQGEPTVPDYKSENGS